MLVMERCCTVPGMNTAALSRGCLPNARLLLTARRDATLCKQTSKRN